MNSTHSGAPVADGKRHIFLDALRGFALLGVCLANYPEFSLYTFQPDTVAATLPGAGIDCITKFAQYLLIDGNSIHFFLSFSALAFPSSLPTQPVAVPTASESSTAAWPSWP